MTASVVPAMTRSRSLFAISSISGLSTSSPLMYADAGGADRAEERQAGERQRSGGRDHGRGYPDRSRGRATEHRDDDLHLVLEAIHEQRADRAVDQARGQRFVFGRAAFTLEVTAGDLAGGVGLFLIVDGQGEEIDAGLDAAGADDGGEHGGLAILGDDGGIGLAGHLAGFEAELAAGPVELYAVGFKHAVYLSVSGAARVPYAATAVMECCGPPHLSARSVTPGSIRQPDLPPGDPAARAAAGLRRLQCWTGSGKARMTGVGWNARCRLAAWRRIPERSNCMRLGLPIVWPRSRPNTMCPGGGRAGGECGQISGADPAAR